MDRAELEEYLGFSLIHSETLESAPINEHLERYFAFNWNLRPELALAPDARYVLTGMSYDGAEMAGFPEVLKISVHRVVENYDVYIDARIITVETPDPFLERAKEAGVPTEGSGSLEFIAYFVHDGILYSVRPYGIYDNTIPGNYVNGRELTILKHILDSFA